MAATRRQRAKGTRIGPSAGWRGPEKTTLDLPKAKYILTEPGLKKFEAEDLVLPRPFERVRVNMPVSFYR